MRYPYCLDCLDCTWSRRKRAAIPQGSKQTLSIDNVGIFWVNKWIRAIEIIVASFRGSGTPLRFYWFLNHDSAILREISTSTWILIIIIIHLQNYKITKLQVLKKKQENGSKLNIWKYVDAPRPFWHNCSANSFVLQRFVYNLNRDLLEEAVEITELQKLQNYKITK